MGALLLPGRQNVPLSRSGLLGKTGEEFCLPHRVARRRPPGGTCVGALVPNASSRWTDARGPSFRRLFAPGPPLLCQAAVALGTALRVTGYKFSRQHATRRFQEPGHPHIRPPDASLPAAHLALPQPRGGLAFEVRLSHHLLPTGLKLKFKLKPKLPLPPSVPVNFPPHPGACVHSAGGGSGEEGAVEVDAGFSGRRSPSFPVCVAAGAAGVTWARWAHSSGHCWAQLAVSGHLMGHQACNSHLRKNLTFESRSPEAIGS